MDQLLGHETCAFRQGPGFRRGPHLVQCFAVTIFKFSILIEQKTPRFHFTLGPVNYTAGPGNLLGIGVEIWDQGIPNSQPDS